MTRLIPRSAGGKPPIILGMARNDIKVNTLDPYQGTGLTLSKMIGHRDPFKRMNLVDGARTWDIEVARHKSAAMRKHLRERWVVVLGKDVWKALGLPQQVGWLESIEDGGATWFLVPHPSGKNLWYNDHNNVRSASRLLRRIAERYES